MFKLRALNRVFIAARRINFLHLHFMVISIGCADRMPPVVSAINP
jgi:hypothetical protein